MDYLKIDKNEERRRKRYDKLLPPERDTKTIQMYIYNFITYLRSTGHSPASVSTYTAAIHKFYSTPPEKALHE